MELHSRGVSSFTPLPSTFIRALNQPQVTPWFINNSTFGDFWQLPTFQDKMPTNLSMRKRNDGSRSTPKHPSTPEFLFFPPLPADASSSRTPPVLDAEVGYRDENKKEVVVEDRKRGTEAQGKQQDRGENLDAEGNNETDWMFLFRNLYGRRSGETGKQPQGV